ncbi:MAG: DUF5916 domain-containing protein [Bacteroidota bacterium]
MFLKYSSFLIVYLVVVNRSMGFVNPTPKSAHATRLTHAISIDGMLNESDWKNAETFSDFRQFDPVEGVDPTEKTDVKLLYDDNALYVGIICHDSDPTGIVKQLTRRDRTVQSDRMSVMIDSYHDHQTAFLFSGSVSDVQSDGVLSNDGRVYDIQWDAVWEFHSTITDSGWTGEFRIPFSALRFSTSDTGYVWGINFRRYIARKKETDEWVMQPRNETPPGTISCVSCMGHLLGLNDIHPPLHLEIVPYTVAKESYLSQPDPFPLQKKFSPNVGADIKYGLTNNFTLDMAINPDFGQVEVDQSVLNLTVFETYYPEKRPFFLEGSQLFAFGTMFDNSQMQLLYSRRIGRHPEPPPGSLLPGYNYKDPPQNTTIVGAAKLTGRTNSGLSIGALSAVTDQEQGVQEDINGNALPPVTFEPRASYNVLRIKQDVMGNSTIGFMGTSVFKDSYQPALNGGTDWNLRTDDGSYAVDGYVAGSDFVDNAGVRYSGGAGRLGLGKLHGDHWLAYSFYDFSSTHYNIDQIGYYSQPREHGGFSEVTYKEDYGPSPIRRYSINFQSDYRWDWDGVATLRDLEINPIFEFENFWALSFDYHHYLTAYDDANRGIIGLYRRPVANDLIMSVQTDIRQPVSLNLISEYTGTNIGKNAYLSSFIFTVRPLTWMEYSPTVTFYSSRHEEAWAIPVYTDDGYNLFGDRDVDEYDFNLRGTITFTTDLSLQFFTQVLLAKGQYTNLRKLTGAESFTPYDYLSDTGSTAFKRYSNPDFNDKTINANLVLRWEYMPGSTFYLVWTQARFGNIGSAVNYFGANFADAFRLPMDNVILAKVSYRWGM